MTLSQPPCHDCAVVDCDPDGIAVASICSTFQALVVYVVAACIVCGLHKSGEYCVSHASARMRVVFGYIAASITVSGRISQ